MLSIIIGAIVMFVIGAVWFTVLFGKTWSRLMNFGPEEQTKAMQGGMAGKLIAMFVLNLVSAGVLAYVLPQLLVFSLGEVIVAVLIIWLGFTLPSLMNAYLWEGKSLKLVAINAGGSLLAFIGGGIAIYLLQ